MEETAHVNASGYIEKGRHKIFWEDWGSRDAKPILYLHGGPGGGVSTYDKMLFDPKLHRVIFHDQRGSGRSKPFAETKENTTQDLISDIESIFEKLNIKKALVMGGSWGSTLSLLYAVAHPERVERLLIWSLFLARQFEIDFVNEGFPRYFFPEAWERFISLVPENNRATGDVVMRYYAEKINAVDESIALHHAQEWALWENTISSMLYDPKLLEIETLEDPSTLAIARLETHYFLNKCFIPENNILNSLAPITHIPCSLIQGRFDMCTPPISALDLKKAYGNNLSLQMVNSGHSFTDPEMAKALRITLSGILPAC